LAVPVTCCGHFTKDGECVVALFAGEKDSIGDVFYNRVGVRADAAITRWIRQSGEQP